jgi:hypothetical protein
VVQSLLGSFDPGFEPVALPALRPAQHHPGRVREQDRRLPRFDIFTRMVRSRVEIYQARQRSSGLLEDTLPVLIAATVAIEMIGPMPGTVIRRSYSLRAISNECYGSRPL